MRDLDHSWKTFCRVIRKDLNKLKKRVFANEIVNLENEQGELLSLFKPTSCLTERECSCIDENCVEVWEGFFAKEEDLRICEFRNGSRPLYVFNGCVLFQAKKGYWFFVNYDNREISNREELVFVKEYCINYEQRLKSKQKVKWDYSEEMLRSELLNKWERGRLYFADSESREVIMEFMGRGKVKLEEFGKF